MSSVAEMFPPREDVYIISDEQLHVISYDILEEGALYTIELISGSFSIYRKTSLFDDDLIEKVKTKLEAIELLRSLKK